MKDVFNQHYKEQYVKAGLLDQCGGELQHVISDAATMQIIRWTDGGFGMAAHNYDGDMLTDEIAQVHRSPGFITSNLIGKSDDGSMIIKEFEASHGTVADMWEAHQKGFETSLNPLGMVEALIGAVDHSVALTEKHGSPSNERLLSFTRNLRKVIHKLMVTGQGTRDICGPSGLTTEHFISKVGEKLEDPYFLVPSPVRVSEGYKPYTTKDAVDQLAIRRMFDDLDTNGDGVIDFEEFSAGLRRLNVQPRKYGFGPN